MRATQVEIENNAIAKEYKELLKISYQTLSSSDKKLIRKAFDLSVEAHNGQRRKSKTRSNIEIWRVSQEVLQTKHQPNEKDESHSRCQSTVKRK